MRSRHPSQSRRRFLQSAAALAGAALLTGSGLGYAAIHRFEVVRQRRGLRGLRSPLRLALVTDLHLGPFLGLRSLGEWLAATTAEAPDLILLGGDLVDRTFRGRLGAVGAVLAGLRAPLGVYAVLGNHDRARYPDPEPLLRVLSDAGIVPLVNAGRRVRNDLYLAGVDDFLSGRPDQAAALAGSDPTAAATILLSHNPDLIPELRSATDLVLCGHTHGGQICPPGIGPIITSSRYGVRFASGWITSPRSAYVSRGLGVTLIPIRWGCLPELTVIELTPA